MNKRSQRDNLLKVLWLASYGYLVMMAAWFAQYPPPVFSTATKILLIVVGIVACAMTVVYPIVDISIRRVRKEPLSPMFVGMVGMLGVGFIFALGLFAYVEYRPCTSGVLGPFPCELDGFTVRYALSKVLLFAGASGIVIGAVAWIVKAVTSSPAKKKR